MCQFKFGRHLLRHVRKTRIKFYRCHGNQIKNEELSLQTKRVFILKCFSSGTKHFSQKDAVWLGES